MPQRLEILRHAIGSDQYGRCIERRNVFVTGDGSPDFPICIAMVEQGFMTRAVGNEITGGDDVFTVTNTGRQYVRDHREPDPNRDWLCLAPWREPWETEAWFAVRAPTRSKARYDAYLGLRDIYDMDGRDLIKIRVKPVPRVKHALFSDTATECDLPFNF